MNYFTRIWRDHYVDGDMFMVIVTTGPDTKPTPDGGPWATQFDVPSCKRSNIATAAKTAEDMVWAMVKNHAPQVFEQAKQLGWVKE